MKHMTTDLTIHLTVATTSDSCRATANCGDRSATVTYTGQTPLRAIGAVLRDLGHALMADERELRREATQDAFTRHREIIRKARVAAMDSGTTGQLAGELVREWQDVWSSMSSDERMARRQIQYNNKPLFKMLQAIAARATTTEAT